MTYELHLNPNGQLEIWATHDNNLTIVGHLVRLTALRVGWDLEVGRLAPFWKWRLASQRLCPTHRQ